jgi:hypothetical protein
MQRQNGQGQVVQIEHRSCLPEDMVLTSLDFHKATNQVAFGNVRASEWCVDGG